MEQALQPEECSQEQLQGQGESKGEAAASNYEPKRFNEKRKAFIAARRELGDSYASASQLWMHSAERAELLEGLSYAELKKRRFV